MTRLLLAGLIVAVWAGGARAEQLAIKTYTIADGLPRDSISRIVRDSRGFLWFCTPEGLSRYDGYEFVTFGANRGLPYGRVNDLLETRKGDYWIATSEGVASFTPQASKRARPATASLFGRTGPDNQPVFVSVMVEDRAGRIWCGSSDGLYRLEQASGGWQLQRVEIGLSTKGYGYTQVSALLEDRQGALWVATPGGLYRRRPDGRSERFSTDNGLPDNNVTALLQDRRGRLWVATTLGLCELVASPTPGRPVVARRWTTNDGLAHNIVRSLLESSQGQLWIGTAGGLSELTAGAASNVPPLRSYTTANGLSDPFVQALEEDRNGNLWIGTESGGATKVAWNGFTTYREQDGLGGTRIASILESQTGQLCVISSGVVMHSFGGRRFSPIRTNLPKQITQSTWGWDQIVLQDHTGEWWISTGQGLCRFPRVDRIDQLASVQPLAVYTAQDGLASDFIFRLYEDSHGDLWISTLNTVDALARWGRKTGRFYRYGQAEHGLPALNSASAFRQDTAGNLWIGFYDGGLARYRDGRFTVFTTADGVPAGQIRALHLDSQGRLWVASGRGGMSRIDHPAAERPAFYAYTTAQGLASNLVSCITEDRWGRLYVGSARGVDRLDPKTGGIKHYTTADGLANNFVNVSFCDRQGTLWFGTLQGLSRFIPQFEPSLPPAPALINGLRVAGVSFDVSELGETDVGRLEFGPAQNQIQIEFFGLDFGPGEALRYQYKLEGADRDWGAPGRQRAVNYASLKPGAYRFRVRTINSDGAASAEPASFEFSILPPLWQRWWFLAALVLFAATAIGAVYRYRVNRLLELERVRTRIASDLHDDIGSGLSQIAILSEVMRRQVGEQDSPATDTLSHMAGTSRDLIDSMSDIVWAINPRRDHLRDLTQRMRRFASDMLATRNIQFRFSAPADGDMKLGADVRRQVFLIFKESLNNMVRHSACTEVEIEFAAERNGLALRMSDNGKGFDQAAASNGQGCASMRRRAQDLGGDLEISSAAGGTTVALRVPLGRR